MSEQYSSQSDTSVRIQFSVISRKVELFLVFLKNFKIKSWGSCLPRWCQTSKLQSNPTNQPQSKQSLVPSSNRKTATNCRMFNEKRVKGKPKEKEKNEDKDQDQKKGEMMIFKTNKKEVAYQQVPGLEVLKSTLERDKKRNVNTTIADQKIFPSVPMAGLKIKCRIENFMSFANFDTPQLVTYPASSDMAPFASWHLIIYPNGKGKSDKGVTSVILQCTGLLAERKTCVKTVTDCRMFNEKLAKENQQQSKKNKQKDQDKGEVISDARILGPKHYSVEGRKINRDRLKKWIHPDGSLTFICNVEFIPVPPKKGRRGFPCCCCCC